MNATRRRVAIAAFLALCAVLAVIDAQAQREGTDFQARWIFGRWFWAGAPLYEPVAGVRGPNLYPPIAIMLFQLHALLPLKPAAAIFQFFNLALIPVAIWLTREILLVLSPNLSRRHARWALILGVVLSAQFILNNVNLTQINLVVFVLGLVGIRAYLKGSAWGAAAGFVGATAIKLVPVFLVLWLIIRGRRRAALAVIPLALACFVLPILQRGPARGWQDVRDYVRQIQTYGPMRGRVLQIYTNQNLAAAIFRLSRPPAADTPGAPGERDYRVTTLSEETARTISRISALLVVLAFLGVLARLRLTEAPITAFELSAAFLVGHLVSSVTEKAHLVTLLFVFATWLSLERGVLRNGERALDVVALALMAATGLIGRDVFGDQIHHLVGGYSVIVWTMLLLFGGCLWLSLRPPRQRLRANSAGPDRSSTPP
ncbi:MAG: hypothetical protein DMD62_02405 [Gemmatimonadetes bacterium]|nr:MAG: hypothetical protein DMD62_02405 [Gemmatimonadota bacterium]